VVIAADRTVPTTHIKQGQLPFPRAQCLTIQCANRCSDTGRPDVAATNTIKALQSPVSDNAIQGVETCAPLQILATRPDNEHNGNQPASFHCCTNKCYKG